MAAATEAQSKLVKPALEFQNFIKGLGKSGQLSIQANYMHSMHLIAIAAGGIRTALFSSGPPSLSFSGRPSEIPGLPSFRGPNFRIHLRSR